MDLIEIAKRDADRLRSELPAAAVTVDGVIVRLSQPGRIFVVEYIGADHCLLGHEEPPKSNGVQVQVLTQQRLELSRAEMMARTHQWARA